MKAIPVYSTFFILAFASFAHAAEQKTPKCAYTDRACLMQQIEVLADKVDNKNWRDLTLRELAKTYTYEGQPDKAIALIDKIENPDTKAMTIRGIGMAAASGKWDRNKYDSLFAKLATKADEINHAPSKGIAYTYIAMSQAFAGQDDAARLTASKMENAALRNKAYGETAEIEAERGDLKNALTSLAALNSPSYRNKAYDTVSHIFLGKAMIEEAYICAEKIDNPYIRAKSIQRILNKGNAEEEDMEPVADVTKDGN